MKIYFIVLDFKFDPACNEFNFFLQYNVGQPEVNAASIGMAKVYGEP